MIGSRWLGASRIILLALGLGIAALAQVPTAQAASPTGRQADPRICLGGNWRLFKYEVNGTWVFFRNQGECVSHLARGGTVLTYWEAG